METQPKYRIYPSLLDKFQELLDYELVAEEDWNKVSEAAHTRGEYLDSEIGDYKLTPDEMYDKIEVELINAINRCPHEPSEAADKGTAFNEIVDCLIEHRKSANDDVKIYSTVNEVGIKVIRAEINNFVFDYDIELCKNIASEFAGSLPQFFANGTMHTEYGDVELYGYIDEWCGNVITDLKTTGKYSFGKFERKWQRHTYPWCVIESGLTTEVASFVYYVIEWAYQRKGEPLTAKSITKEEYTYDHETSCKLLYQHVCNFIEWLESRKHLITDKRIFVGTNPEGYIGIPITVEQLS